MKFEKLYERARILNCDYIVTGHYARIEEQNGRFVLKKGRCPYAFLFLRSLTILRKRSSSLFFSSFSSKWAGK